MAWASTLAVTWGQPALFNQHFNPQTQEGFAVAAWDYSYSVSAVWVWLPGSSRSPHAPAQPPHFPGKETQVGWETSSGAFAAQQGRGWVTSDACGAAAYCCESSVAQPPSPRQPCLRPEMWARDGCFGSSAAPKTKDEANQKQVGLRCLTDRNPRRGTWLGSA